MTDKINKILLPSSSSEKLEEATSQIPNRSPLYDVDDKQLYVKYDEELIPIGKIAVDDYNIQFDADHRVKLNENITVKTVTVEPVASGIAYNASIDFGKQPAFRSIRLICKKQSGNHGVIGGMIYEQGEGVDSVYHFMLTPSGSRSLSGATTYSEKAIFVQVTIKGDTAKDPGTYLGIQFPANSKAQLYFNGFNTIDKDSLYIRDISEDDIGEKGVILPLSNVADTGSETLLLTVSSNTQSTTKERWDFNASTEFSTGTYSDYVSSKRHAAVDVTGTTRSLSIPASGRAWRINVSASKNDSINSDAGNILFGARNNIQAYVDLLPNEQISVLFYVSSVAERHCFLSEVTDSSDADPTKWTLKQVADTQSNSTNIYFVEYNNSTSQTKKIAIGSTSNFYLGRVTIIEREATFLEQITNLPATGSKGAPHEVVFESGAFDTASFTDLAELCKSPGRLINLDLSKASVGTDLTDIIDNIFQRCYSLCKISLPQGINSIDSQMFNGCVNLTSVTFPEGLTALGDTKDTSANDENGMLTGTHVESVYLPKSIQTVQAGFAKNSMLSDIYISSDTYDPLTQSELFADSSLQEGISIHCKQTFLDTLTETDEWPSWFGSDSSGIEIDDGTLIIDVED